MGWGWGDLAGSKGEHTLYTEGNEEMVNRRGTQL